MIASGVPAIKSAFQAVERRKQSGGLESIISNYINSGGRDFAEVPSNISAYITLDKAQLHGHISCKHASNYSILSRYTDAGNNTEVMLLKNKGRMDMIGNWQSLP